MDEPDEKDVSDVVGLRGEEPNEEYYFCFSATLRVHGDRVPFDAISERLGVEPTHLHRKGEKVGPGLLRWKDDAWHFQPSLPETEPLEQHIDALWDVVCPHVEYLKALKERLRVDVFCSYRPNCDTAGFEIPHSCLRLFLALEVPFGVSVIIA
jgi:hypothetical protein